MKLVPFWTDDFPRPADLAAAPLPDEVDVAVVGAGLTGLMAARRIARSGARVAVLEAGRVGAGASTISGGMTIYGPKAGVSALIDTLGPEVAREIWQANLDCVDLVEKVVVDEGIECDFRRDGSAQLAYDAAALAGIAAKSRFVRDTYGFEAEVFGPDRVR